MRKRTKKEILESAVPRLSGKNEIAVGKNFLWLPVPMEVYNKIREVNNREKHPYFQVLQMSRGTEGGLIIAKIALAEIE